MDWGNVQVALFVFAGSAIYSLIGFLEAKSGGEAGNFDKVLISLVTTVIAAIVAALLWGSNGQPSPGWVAGQLAGGGLANYVGGKGFSVTKNLVRRAWR